MQVQGVRAARVMIVQPENRLLLTDQGVKSTASVFVDVGGGRLDTDQVNAIRNLVANAVQGLAPDQVAVVDNRGRVLSEELKQDPTLSNASSQMRYRQQVEDYFAKKVETMLAAVIGPGNAVVRVSAEIDTEATTLSEEKFDPEGQVVRSQTVSEETNNSTESRTGGGVVGVSANVPEKNPGTEAARPTSNTEGSHKSRTTSYEINRVTTNTTRNPGTVRNLTAAVFVAPRPAPAPAVDAKGAAAPAEAPKRTAEEMNALRQVVINALGLKPAAGQSLDSLVTVQEMSFQTAERIPAEVASIEKESRWQGWIEAGSRWAAVAGAALVMLMFWRMLGRQKPEAVPVEVLSLTPEAASRALPSSNGVTPDLLNELIRQKPANVGVALRDWVAAGSAKN
jgi:flagellar M-ring protein FliF